MNRWRLWNSRPHLSILSLLLIISILITDYWTYTLESNSKNDEDPSVMEDLDYAMDAMNYLHDAQNGRAVIDPVVEEEKDVIEHYWSCSLDKVKKIRSSSHIHSWVQSQSFHLFSAYIDERNNSLYPYNNIIQVLAMSFRAPNSTIYCNIFTNGKSTVVESTVREIWQRGWDPRGNFFVPLLISCPIPLWIEDYNELSIQITTEYCRTENESIAVKVPERKNPKAKVAVCVKGMDFNEDLGNNLIEWLEAQFLFGADTVTIYVYTVTPSTKSVLEWYEKQGKIELIWIDLPGEDSPHIPLSRSVYMKRNRQQKRRHELIPYNDCLYRHINSHEYVLIIDIDELIVPITHSNWIDLLNEAELSAKGRKIASISMRNVFKFPQNETNSEKSKILPMVSNRKRSRTTSKRGDYGKSFSCTSNIATVFNHFALHRLTHNISHTLHLPEHSALKLHYKSSCPIESRTECPDLISDTVDDPSIDPFADQLEKRVRVVREKMHL